MQLHISKGIISIGQSKMITPQQLFLIDKGRLRIIKCKLMLIMKRKIISGKKVE